MALADRFARPGRIALATAPSEITCQRYDPLGGSKRCKHYLKGGACALPDELMCVEWLKANGHFVPPPLPPLETAEEAAARTPPESSSPAATRAPSARSAVTDRDLFGAPVQGEPTRRAPDEREATIPSPPRTSLEADVREVPVVRNLSDEDIASFKALNVEVCLEAEGCGEIWIVPEYTGRTDRKEISARDAATLAAACSAFPGARVTSFEKLPANKPTA